MHKKFLITLSSPVAIRTDMQETKMVNVVEATFGDIYRDQTNLRISRWFNSHNQLMEDTKLVDILVKNSNIRCKQEVR